MRALLLALAPWLGWGQPPAIDDIKTLLSDQRFEDARQRARTLVDSGKDATTVDAIALELLARAEIGAGNLSDAVPLLLGRAAAIHSRLSGERSLGMAGNLVAQGWFLAAKTRYSGAIPLYRKAAQMQEDLQAPPPELADTYHALTRALHATDKFDEAIVTGRRTLSLRHAAAGPDSAQAGNGHYTLGFALERLKVAEAQAEYGRALELLEKHRGPTHADVGDTCEALGRLQYAQKHYAEAQKWYERTIAIVEKNFPPQHPRFISLLNNYALSRKIQGDYAGSRDAFHRALSISMAVYGEDNSRTAQVLANLGIVLQDLGDYSGALRTYERALRVQTRLLGDQHILVARIYRSMQRLQQVLGDYRSAERLCRQARAIFEKALGADNESTIEASNHCALLLDSMGRDREALPLAQDTLRRAEKVHGADSWAAALANRMMGTIELGLGQSAAARGHLQSALQLSQKHNDGRTHALALRQLTTLALRERTPAEALSYARMGTAEASAYFGARSPDLVPFLREEALALDASGRRAQAFEKAAESEVLRQDAVRTTAAGIPERMAITYRGDDLPALDYLLRWMQTPEEKKRTWDLLIRGRNMVLDETTTRSREWRRQGDPQTAASWIKLKEARAQLAAATLRASEGGIKQSERDLERARREKERLETELAATSLQRRRSGLDEVLRALPTGTVLIAFSATDRYRAFTGNSRGMPVVFDLAPAATVDALVRNWRNEISRERDAFGRNRAANEKTYTAAALALRRSVWDPLQAAIAGAQRVLIVPDGRLHEINFAALPTAEGHFLIERGPMIHILNAELDVLAPPLDTSTADRRMFALGAPSFDGAAQPAPLISRVYRGGESSCKTFRDLKFAPLPGSGLEVSEATSFAKARGWKVESLQGPAASESALKQSVHGQRVVHIATHGFFLDRDCGGTQLAESPLLRAGLALAGANRRTSAKSGEEDGVLTAEEAASLDLDGTAWIVLSGCDTGAGEIHSSEGVLGLRRALQEAGARTQITSLWPVRDDDARLWMRSLYEGRLQRGLSTIEAFTRASRTELARRRAAALSTHPFHWASFVASGDWR
ncbi:MAG: CHAT domain-containing protein [Acidobacteria bacterium]|nr:CHAT domain-containing protein [Acidobacteriota bacterium]